MNKFIPTFENYIMYIIIINGKINKELEILPFFISEYSVDTTCYTYTCEIHKYLDILKPKIAY